MARRNKRENPSAPPAEKQPVVLFGTVRSTATHPAERRPNQKRGKSPMLYYTRYDSEDVDFDWVYARLCVMWLDQCVQPPLCFIPFCPCFYSSVIKSSHSFLLLSGS